MKRALLPLTAILVAAFLMINSQVSNAVQSGDEADIKRVVNDYFEGFKKADFDQLRRAFHPECRVFSAGKGKVSVFSQEDWYGALDRMPPEIMERLDPKSKILSIDVSGSAAVVKTNIRFPEVNYTDFLSMLKVDGKWIIVNKTYDTKQNVPK
jgi:Putative lumazine-binding